MTRSAHRARGRLVLGAAVAAAALAPSAGMAAESDPGVTATPVSVQGAPSAGQPSADAEPTPAAPTVGGVGLPLWGNWCGPGHGGGEPTDLLDAACQRHDACYAQQGYWDRGCDLQLIAEIERDLSLMTLPEGAAATVVWSYFTLQTAVTG